MSNPLNTTSRKLSPQTSASSPTSSASDSIRFPNGVENSQLSQPRPLHTKPGNFGMFLEGVGRRKEFEEKEKNENNNSNFHIIHRERPNKSNSNNNTAKFSHTHPPNRPFTPSPIPSHHSSQLKPRILKRNPSKAPNPTSISLGQERKMSFFKLSDFAIVKPLGTGTFGRVYLARFQNLPKYFALKKLRKIDILRLKQCEHIQNERSLLSRLNHPFLVKMYAAMQDDLNLYMLMEYAPGGELFHYLRMAGRLNINAARFYAAELVLALEYLHARNIAYRDLKPENLLLDQEGHLKLADFGFAKLLLEDATWTLCGTPEYLAPEIILGKGYGKSVDWWALGVLLYEMMVGNPPFMGSNPTQVYEKTLKGTPYFPPQHLPPIATSFISSLLTTDHQERLGCSGPSSIAHLKSHPFFEGIDWRLVANRTYIPPIIPKFQYESGGNFPLDDCKSSMDVHFEDEAMIVGNHSYKFPGFIVDR